MKEITAFSIQVWDGGERHNHKFYVTDRAEANKWLKNNKYDIVVEKTFIFFDTLQEAIDNDLATVRRRALEKLTALEKRALGINQDCE